VGLYLDALCLVDLADERAVCLAELALQQPCTLNLHARERSVLARALDGYECNMTKLMTYSALSVGAIGPMLADQGSAPAECW
jgi:hypothetical protein